MPFLFQNISLQQAFPFSEHQIICSAMSKLLRVTRNFICLASMDAPLRELRLKSSAITETQSALCKIVKVVNDGHGTFPLLITC